LSIGIGFYLGKTIRKSAGEVLKVLETAGQGDLSARVVTGQRDELGLISMGVNQMLQELEILVRQLKNDSLFIKNQSAVIEQQLNQVKAIIAEGNQVVREVAVGSEGQATGAAQATAAVNELNSSIQEIAKVLSKMSEAAQAGVEKSRFGQTVIEEAIDEMGFVTEAVIQ